MYDYQLGRKIPLAPWLHETLDSVTTEETKEAKRWQNRRAEIDKWIQALEAASIFSGKEEDFGSATKG